MGHSESGAKERRPWNAGRKLGGKRALKPQQVWAIRFWLDRERRLRDRAMFDLAIDSKLRGCDVVKAKIGDLISGGRVRTRVIVIQQKTGRPVQFELLEPARGSILAGSNAAAARSTTSSFQAGSIMPIISALGSMLGSSMSGSPGSDCAGRTTGRIRFAEPRHRSSISKQVTCVRLQILLGHTKIESTVRYLGVDIEDALALAEGTEV
jgi:hypothetical protein